MRRLSWVQLTLGLAAAAALPGACSRQGDSGSGGSRGAGGPPVSVQAGRVTQKDTPVYLDGIGTVQAFNSVTVHTQVNGILQKIAFVEGQDVAAGDLLAVVDPRTYQAEFDQAKAKKAEDDAQLSNALVTYRRNFTLLKKGLIDQQTVDTEKASVDQFEAMVQADAAALEQAAVQLGFCHIVAPIGGRTGLRLVDQGNLVQTSDASGIVVITQLKPISVLFTLPQQDWPQIQQLLASGSKLRVLATGDGPAPLDEGTLAVVDNQIDSATGTIKLKASFPNEHLALWPGQFVNVRLLVQVRRQGVIVPASVVQRGPQGAFAFVIGDNATVRAVPIQVAQIDAGYALIDRGLTPGQQVVVDGQYKLEDGSKVSITAAAPRAGRSPSGNPSPGPASGGP
jgi:multidrug efflux system membrane fusion protein